MLDLFPAGFEEVERGATLELAAYTDADGAARLWRSFGEYASADVAEDWAERWRRFHRPASAGGLWIGPPWLAPPQASPAVLIDPGRAFGTGAHPTTRLCVELLATCERGSLLDAGAGSGVLAIAAVRLGFHPVTAVDHDEVAVEAAGANARLNGVDVDARLLDVLLQPLPAVDVLAANVSRQVVEHLAPRSNTRVLVTSGYFSSDELRLPGFEHRDRRVELGWAADLWGRAS